MLPCIYSLQKSRLSEPIQSTICIYNLIEGGKASPCCHINQYLETNQFGSFYPVIKRNETLTLQAYFFVALPYIYYIKSYIKLLIYLGSPKLNLMDGVPPPPHVFPCLTSKLFLFSISERSSAQQLNRLAMWCLCHFVCRWRWGVVVKVPSHKRW